MSNQAHAMLIVGADSRGVTSGMQRAQAEIERGVRAGIASFKRLDAQVEASGRKMAQARSGGSGAYRAGMAGQQISDIAVQLQGGAKMATVIGQQIPQLLSAFGPMGSILGTVVAVGAGIASWAMNTKEATVAAEKYAKQMNNVAAGMKATTTAVDSLQTQQRELLAFEKGGSKAYQLAQEDSALRKAWQADPGASQIATEIKRNELIAVKLARERIRAGEAIEENMSNLAKQYREEQALSARRADFLGDAARMSTMDNAAVPFGRGEDGSLSFKGFESGSLANSIIDRSMRAREGFGAIAAGGRAIEIMRELQGSMQAGSDLEGARAIGIGPAGRAAERAAQRAEDRDLRSSINRSMARRDAAAARNGAFHHQSEKERQAERMDRFKQAKLQQKGEGVRFAEGEITNLINKINDLLAK